MAYDERQTVNVYPMRGLILFLRFHTVVLMYICKFQSVSAPTMDLRIENAPAGDFPAFSIELSGL